MGGTRVTFSEQDIGNHQQWQFWLIPSAVDLMFHLWSRQCWRIILLYICPSAIKTLFSPGLMFQHFPSGSGFNSGPHSSVFLQIDIFLQSSKSCIFQALEGHVQLWLFHSSGDVKGLFFCGFFFIQPEHHALSSFSSGRLHPNRQITLSALPVFFSDGNVYIFSILAPDTYIALEWATTIPVVQKYQIFVWWLISLIKNNDQHLFCHLQLFSLLFQKFYSLGKGHSTRESCLINAQSLSLEILRFFHWLCSYKESLFHSQSD